MERCTTDKSLLNFVSDKPNHTLVVVDNNELYERIREALPDRNIICATLTSYTHMIRSVMLYRSIKDNKLFIIPRTDLYYERYEKSVYGNHLFALYPKLN